MLNYYDLEVSQVFIHEHYIINQIREGKNIQPKHTRMLEEVMQKHFKDAPIIYISNRVHSYSVNPLTYEGVSNLDNLIAIAIVVYNEDARKAAKFERNFYSKPFEIFDSLSEAIGWTHLEYTKVITS